MGISGLYSLLRPYAQPVVFPNQSSSSTSITTGSEHPTQAHLYIDGPAFAYHVYHTSLNANYYDSLGRVRRNPFDAVVEYDEFVQQVGSFLGKLEEVGFIISGLHSSEMDYPQSQLSRSPHMIPHLNVRQKIFFDGYLPKAKLPTRLGRLSHSLSQLIAYHSLHPTHIPSFNSSNRHASSSTRATQTSRQHKLPSPPFIVNTALSYLVGSKWRGLVGTVPGEADAWCASAAVRRGGWVMSGDTDLLLYGHGEGEIVGEEGVEPKEPPAWGVIMFRDFSFEDREDGKDQLLAKAMAFHPNQLNSALFRGEDLVAILAGSTSGSKKSSSGKKGEKMSKNLMPPAASIMDRFNQPEYIKATARPPPSLLNLAYHLQNETCASMSRLKQLVKQSSLLPDVSQRELAFRREYQLVAIPLLESHEKPEGKNSMEMEVEWQIKHLDPRFSELVYQLPCLSNQVHPPILSASSPKRTRKTGETKEVEVDSFLPFLYEDPTRSGAWDVGRDIRGVVYGILEAYQNKASLEEKSAPQGVRLIVKEHVRRGKRIKDVFVKASGEAITSEEVKGNRILSQRLTEYIEAWKDKRDKPSTKGDTKRERGCECSNYWWVEMVIEMVVRDHAEKGKNMPLSSEVGVIVHMLSQTAKEDGQRYEEGGMSKGKSGTPENNSAALSNPLPAPQEPKAASSQQQLSDPPSRWSWSMIHLFAQVQAGVYSLWMLKQLIVFALALGDTLSTEERRNIVELAALLNRVPPVEHIIAGKKFLEGLARQEEGVDRWHCEVCGFGEESIMGALVEKWHIWGVESEEMDLGENEEGEDEEHGKEEEDEQRRQSRGTWGGMDIDF